MPGIFGCMTVDPERRLDAGTATGILDRMEERLRHLDSYVSDRRADSAGRWMVGRIGHESLVGADIRYSTGGDGAEAIIYGSLKENAAAQEHARGRDTDPLLRTADRSGYFSAFYLEKPGGRLALVVDRRASEPIFYVESGGILYFAPEVKCLLDLPAAAGEVDPAAVASLLGSGYLLPDQTLFSNIRKLTSRHFLVVEGARCREVEYWKYEPGSESFAGTPDEMAGHLAELVERSVLDDFDTPGGTVTFLSGGLDSRYLLGCIARRHPELASSLHAVTWAEDKDIPGADPEIAAIVAEELGVRHQFQRRSVENFAEWFRETAYLLDGHSEVAAFHPHEYQIMKSLHGQGFRRVIRGDEAFGLRGHVYSPEASLANIEIRPFAGIQTLPEVMRPSWYRRASEAGADSFSRLVEAGAGMDPVDYKDVCYFSLRVPTYLSSASYYKQILLDHRNPLLANEILDFYRSVPIEQRLHKKLFFRAFEIAHPDLASIPYSTTPGTEDWGALMAEDTPVRAMILRELEDTRSGIWEIFDREKLIDLFGGLSVASGTTRIPAWKQPLRKIRDWAALACPKPMGRVALRLAQTKLRVSQLMFRVLVLKYWHDTFVADRRR